MEKINHEISLLSARNLLLQVVEGTISKEQSQWIREKLHEIGAGIPENKFYQILGKIPSVFPKEKTAWSANCLKKAFSVQDGWDPQEWTLDQSVRAIVLLSRYEASPADFESTIRKYHQTADLGELIVLYLVLPLLPEKEKVADLAALGARSNMKAVFEAIALNNPYPRLHFDISRWNQLVLKAIFIGSPLYKIQGLDEKANGRLAAMLCDFAHERWAAGRSVSPELWRPVGPFVNDTNFKDLLHAFEMGNELEQEAVALACSCSDHAPAREFLKAQPVLDEKIRSKEIHWAAVGEKWERLQK